MVLVFKSCVLGTGLRMELAVFAERCRGTAGPRIASDQLGGHLPAGRRGWLFFFYIFEFKYTNSNWTKPSRL